VRGFVYARVSTQQQAEKELSISAQLRAMQGYLHDEGLEIVREYVDRARSGRTSNRPAFNQMLEDLAHSNIDFICVWKLDRLARNVEIAAALDRYCREHGVRIISLQEPLDDSAQGKLMARIFESFAEFYSNNLSQDIRRGKRECARQGYYPHGRAPFGYVKRTEERTGRRILIPDDAHSPTVVRIFTEYANGKTGSRIAVKLNAEGITTACGNRWRPQRIYEILRNPVYCGDVVVGNVELGLNGKHRPGKDPITIQDVHQLLVSRELFEQANRILEARSGSVAQRCWATSPYLLSGLVRCELCGHPLAGESAKGGQYHYYTCLQYLREGKEVCSGVRVPKRRLERFVIARVRDVVLEEQHLKTLSRMVNEEMAASRGSVEEETESARRLVSQTKSRLQRHYDALETKTLALHDLAPRIRELRHELDAAERRLAQLETESRRAVPLVVDERSVEEHVRRLRQTLSRGTVSDRKQVLAGVLESVTVGPDLVSIEYRLPHPNEATDGSMPPVLSAVRPIGGERIRTANLCVANAALSRLELRPQKKNPQLAAQGLEPRTSRI
jgi:site-specific DNA recombinase